MKKIIEIINRSDLLKSLIILGAATAVSGLFLHLSSGDRNVIVFYILAVVMISRVTNGFVWGIIASLAGIIGMNYFFTFPYWKIDFTQPGYPIAFFSMLLVSIITSAMTAQIKQQAQLSSVKEYRTARLYEISKKLLAAKGEENIIALAVDSLYQLSHRSSAFYLSDPLDGGIGIYRAHTVAHRNMLDHPEEFHAVHHVYETNHAAGFETGICPQANGLYLPVISQNRVIGVAGLFCKGEEPIERDMITLLEMMLAQVALALEKQWLFDKQNRIMMESEMEKMRSNLLRAISHDLRTPLTGILGASSAVLENKNTLTEQTHDKLIQDIKDDSQWLIRMVENLLSVTRMVEGASALKKSPEAVEEIVGEAIARIRKQYPQRQIKVQVPDEFLMVSMDGTLIEQVLMNLIENAIKHSGKESRIHLDVYRNSNAVFFQVMDNGIGLNPDRIPQLLKGHLPDHDKSADSSRGMGIGLPICVSIVKAHGGQLTAENRDEGGAVFRFWLPYSEERD